MFNSRSSQNNKKAPLTSSTVKKKVSFPSGSSGDPSPKTSSVVSPTGGKEAAFYDYALDRAQSATGMLKAEGHDLTNPNVNTFIVFVKKLEALVTASVFGKDDLLEDVQARHLLKSIYSYGLIADTAIKANTLQTNVSVPATLPKSFAKCAEWLDVNKLLVNKSMMWWAYQIGNIAMKWSDVDEQFCKAAAFEADAFLNWMRQCLSSRDLQLVFTSNKEVYLLLEIYLGVVYNIARVSDCRPKLNELNFVEPVSFFLTCTDQACQCLALMFTTFIVGDSDSARISDEFGIIPTLTRILDIASDLDDHFWLGFTVEELAHGISLVMVNDSNKAKFVSAGILPILDRMLAKSDREGELIAAIDCLWTLAFGENERKEILKTKSIIENLNKFSTENSKHQLKIKASKALDFIENGKSNLSNLTSGSGSARRPRKRSAASSAPAPPLQAVPEESGHIFISYSWKQQETCKRIRDLLRENGYKTWMDIDAMRGSTLEAMAGAIEKAKLVVICYSDDYKQSPNCRTEAEYMYQLQKSFVPVNMQRRYKPDGWLGLILGARFYVDMSLVKTPFEDAADKLVVELKNILDPGSASAPRHLPDVSSHNAAKIVDPMPQKTQSEVPSNSYQVQHLVVPSGQGKKLLSVAFVKSKVDAWTSDDVQAWLERQFLSKSAKLASLFKGMTGRHLSVIYEMKTLSADIFYTSLLKSLGGSLVDVLKLSEALERLPSVLASAKP